MTPLLVIPLHLVDPAALVRVDDPDHAGSIARSATGAILLEPPTDGTPWRWESIPVPTVAATPDDAGTWPATEAFDVTNADLWHADGVTGAGVKIAVFDLGWFAGPSDPVEVGAYESRDCFVTPTCEAPFDPLRPHLEMEGGVHGWACAETIREVAPDAELTLVRVNSFTMLENATAWAIRERIDLISMSMSYYNGSFYDGTGEHDGLTRSLEAANVLMVTSAGNDSMHHWSGDWSDADGDDRFDGDGDGAVLINAEANVHVYVNWNQYGGCGQTDIDVFLVDASGTVYGSSEDLQNLDDEECTPVERLQTAVPTPGIYRLELRRRRGGVVGLRVNVFSRAESFVFPVRGASITDPAAHPLAVAVGAVRASNYWDGPPEGFSAQGPSLVGVPKPDIAGPDGLTGAAYGPVGFYGTSASTPAVVGLIALAMSDDPSLTSREAFQRVQAWARDADGSSFAPDDRFGAGKARLPVRDPGPAGCGRQPLILVFLPFGWIVARGKRGER